MQTVIFLGTHPVTFNQKNFENEVDIDELMAIDHGNLYGEAVTISALLNQVGSIKAHAEEEVARQKLKVDVYEAELKQRFRKDSTVTAQKVTEAGLNEMVLVDVVYQNEKKKLIKANFNLSVIEGVWWAVKSKDQKLNNLIKGITPNDLFNELIEGTINNIVLKKRKSITEG